MNFSSHHFVPDVAVLKIVDFKKLFTDYNKNSAKLGKNGYESQIKQSGTDLKHQDDTNVNISTILRQNFYVKKSTRYQILTSFQIVL